MQDIYNEIDELIAKVLAKEANTSERKQLDDWVAQSPANAAHFAQSVRLWELMEREAALPDVQVDSDAAWRAVQQRIKVVERPKSMLNSRWLMAAAAAVALLLGAFWLIRLPKPMIPEKRYASTETTVSDALSDGTLVTLNRNTCLVAAQNFGKRERRVSLRGEAYFQVAHDASKPFVVAVNTLEVRVLGTIFNVQESENQRATQVHVFEGRVEVSNGTEKRILQKGESVKYDAVTGTFDATGPADANARAFMTRKFSFDGKPLSEALGMIGHAYGVEIKIESEVMRNCPLTARFNQEQSLADIFLVLEETYGFKVVGSAPEQFILKAGTCE